MLVRFFSTALMAASLLSAPVLAADRSDTLGDIALARNSMLLFGGPSEDYPRIGLVTWGQGLSVLSCEPRAAWCEVEADGQRGWVRSSKLTWGDDGQRKVMRKRIAPLRLTL